MEWRKIASDTGLPRAIFFLLLVVGMLLQAVLVACWIVLVMLWLM